MAASNKPSLSVREKLRLAIRLLTIIPLFFVVYTVRSGFFALRNGLPLRPHMGCAVGRILLRRFSAREAQYVMPTTAQAYEAWTRRKVSRAESGADRERLKTRVQPLDSADAVIMWIGDRERASKLVLFLHGGGYKTPAFKAQIEWCWNSFVQAGAEAGVEVAVGLLDYSLAPEARFPVQLRQAVAALGALLEAGVRPADIFLGGDSAGANLTVQLLGHLLHPHPDVRQIALGEPLAGAFVVSPWVSCNKNRKSYGDHGWHDMLARDVIVFVAEEYFGGPRQLDEVLAGGNPWAFPLDADGAGTWFQGADGLVSSFLVTFGRAECFADESRELATLFRSSHPTWDLRVDEADGEAHVFALAEHFVGEIGVATRRIKHWFSFVITAKPMPGDATR
ncbi:hypothetical protein CDD83_9831 [Cordyceps sp. RAO-2017]|nr:hypothetical protein CDD83_9831 [Cordyceps sp. RAO-2017]